MRIDEAEKIAKLIGRADGGCFACAEELTEAANLLFANSGFSWEVCDERIGGSIRVDVKLKYQDNPYAAKRTPAP